MSEVKQQSSTGLVAKFAERYSVDAGKMFDTLKATAFKQRDGSAPSNEQMMALLVVADQYKLNPFTREIYAFPDRQNGIVPVVGVDGWSRIINSHPEFDGMEFRYSDEMVTPDGAKSKCHEWVECIMYRKDRNKPVVVREYLDEVYRAPFKAGMVGPWQSHPKRFLRHKATIQCSRLAFGFVGIFDQDEAERIQDAKVVQGSHSVVESRQELPAYTDEQFAEKLPRFESAIQSGNLTADDVIATIESGAVMSESQKEQIKNLEKQETPNEDC